MALSVNAHGEECRPPSNFVNLAYNSLTPVGIDDSTTFNIYSSDGLAIELQNILTVPTQCNTGLDIVFLVDYTGSMGNAINGVKAGITNILSTIDNESLGNYRVGLCIFDEYYGNITSPNNYGSTSTYLNLPASQKERINTFNNRTQFITCVQPLGNVGSNTDFVSKLNLLATPTFPLGNGQGTPEPGGEGINAILSNNIAGSFRSNAIKLIILITDAVPGGNDDTNNSTDQTYFEYNLLGICNSYDTQLMVQSTLSPAYPGNYYYGLSIATTPSGRYDQVTFDANGNWINTGLISGIQNLCNDSYIASCDSAPSGWYYEYGADFAFYYDSELGYATEEYWFPPEYTVYANFAEVTEQNRSVRFTVETKYVPAGTTLYWELESGYANADDLVEGVNNGYITVSDNGQFGNVGWFDLTTYPDNFTEGNEWLIVLIKNASLNTVGSTEVRVIDTSMSPTPTPTATAIPPTPTPTAIPACYTVQLTLASYNSSGYVQYIDCNGSSQMVFMQAYSQPTIICARSISYTSSIITEYTGTQCYSTSGAGAGYPTATPIPPTPTPTITSSGGAGYPTATPRPTDIIPTATPRPTDPPVFLSYIAERNDGAAYEYVGPFDEFHNMNDLVEINDGSGLCWTLGAAATVDYTYIIEGPCRLPVNPPDPTPTPDNSGGGGGCLIIGTPVKLANGTYINIENLQVNQELASVTFGNMPDSDNYSILAAWSQSNPVLTDTTANVTGVDMYNVNSLLDINDGLLRSSMDHLHVVKRNGNWRILKASELQLNDILFNNDSKAEIIITNLEVFIGSYNVYKINVEANDTFIANGIVTHNRKDEFLEPPI